MSTAVGGVLSGAGAIDEAQQQRQLSPFETSCAVSAENGSGDGGAGGGNAKVGNEENAATGGRPAARVRPAGSVPLVGYVPPGISVAPSKAATAASTQRQSVSGDPMAAPPRPRRSVPPPPPQQQLPPVPPSLAQQQQQQRVEGEALDSGTESMDIDEELLEGDKIRARLEALLATGLLPGFEEEVRAEEAAVGVSSQPFDLLGGGSSFPPWEDYEDDDDGGSEDFEEWNSLMINRLDLMEGCLALQGVAPGG